MSVQIRSAVIGDEYLLLSFIKELAEYEKLAHEVVATPENLKDRLFGENPKVFAVIAELDGEPVGFALYFYNFSTFLGRHGLYLEDLYVRRTARGKGIGRTLLKHLAKVAIDNECGRLEWWVLDWNTPAIYFYKSLNAVPMDEWTVFRLTGTALVDLAK
jgi:GNAT superfamily N-acetyltransferase